MKNMSFVLAALSFSAHASTPPLTPQFYRAQLAPVTSCARFAQDFPHLPDARPLLRGMFRDGVPVQNEDQTEAAFANKVVDRMFDALGDPSRVYLQITLDGATRYDGVARVMHVALPATLWAELGRWGRTVNRMGTGASLVTETQLLATLPFSADDRSPEISLPMTPDEADRFARQGRLETLSVLADIGTDAEHSPARPGQPATQTSYRLVRLQPKCAVITNGSRPIGDWTYDRWEAAASGG